MLTRIQHTAIVSENFVREAKFYEAVLGMERAEVSAVGGDEPGLKVEGRTELSYEPLVGPDGKPSTVRNALFGFAPEFEVGTTTGSSNAFGLSFEGSYGETAQYMFSSEETEGTVKGRA